MLQVIYDKSGRVKIKNVPVPQITDNEVLVKNSFSVLSAGTEKSMINLMKKPLWKMAIDRPDLAGQVLKFAKGAGIKKTMDLVKSRLDVWHLLGYSSSGIVVKVGKNVTDYSVGDKVACIGSGFANHAEYISVPKNLVAKIPKNVELKDAAFSGIACIALQSIRQINPQLGETIVVIGLGLIGQMVAQMLRANGCKVIGIDLDKSKTAKGYVDEGITKDTVKNVLNVTDNIGADGVIIAADTKHNLINDSFDMCRKKGRVVLLGISGMNIDRQKMFEKELEFKISTAFGAGAFDIYYNELGKEYPIEYARWTSNRNLKAILELLSTKKLDVSDMTSQIFEIKDAIKAYNSLNNNKIITGLFSYNQNDLSQTIDSNKSYKKTGKINVAVIGAGQFVKGFILPALKKNKDFSLYAIVTKNGHNAKKLTQEYNAKLASTSYKDIINNKNVDLVIIGTRHDSHAKIAIESLRKDKHVYCEKPMAINEKEFKVLEKEIKKSKQTYTCGFNRRYSQVFQKIKLKIDNKKPMIVNYIFNNVYLPKDHWVNVPEIGGGRIIGEACHIVDLFNFLTDSYPISIKTQQISSTGNQKSNDDNNIISIIKYKDGSVCNLTYSCTGNANVQRERCTIIQDGNVIEMDGFGKATMNNKSIYNGKTDEGYDTEILELSKKLLGKESLTVSSDSCINTTKTTFGIVKNTK